MEHAPRLVFRLPLSPSERRHPHDTGDYRIAMAVQTPPDKTPPCRLWERGADYHDERILLLEALPSSRNLPYRVFASYLGDLYSEYEVKEVRVSDAYGNEMMLEGHRILSWPRRPKDGDPVLWSGRPVSNFAVKTGIRLSCAFDLDDAGKPRQIPPLEY